jgi:23S rRNA (uracil1939-C5)-methyltransferase
MARRKREPETAAIESATHDGRGIAAVTGKKVFVAGALKGETVRFQRRKRRRNYDEAELLEVLEPSPARIQPRCAVFGRCGGCSLQHISQDSQREIKQQTLADSLTRIGQVEPARWLAPLFDTGEGGGWHYRRRARLAVKDVSAKGRVLVGFREAHAPYVCDMQRCEVLGKPVAELLVPLSELVGGLTIRRRLPQIEVAIAEDCTALVFRVLDPPSAADVDALRAFGERYDIRIGLQPGGPATVESLDGGPLVLSYSLPEFSVDIDFGPTDFVQVNGLVNRMMVSKAVELLDVGPDNGVLDLFCGIGNFSLPLARRAGRVLGIELESRQVQRGRQNAERNGISNCEFRAVDLADISGDEAWLADGWDRMLLDPARSGARDIVESADQIGAARIVYVSCHPGTLARDAGILVNEKGYRLEAAGIIDMFPHTGHVESLAVFQKS